MKKLFALAAITAFVAACYPQSPVTQVGDAAEAAIDTTANSAATIVDVATDVVTGN